jgi:hypothetical protein
MTDEKKENSMETTHLYQGYKTFLFVTEFLAQQARNICLFSAA